MPYIFNKNTDRSLIITHGELCVANLVSREKGNKLRLKHLYTDVEFVAPRSMVDFVSNEVAEKLKDKYISEIKKVSNARKRKLKSRILEG